MLDAWGAFAIIMKEGVLGAMAIIFLWLFVKEHQAKDDLSEKRHQELMAINELFVELCTSHNSFLQTTNQLLGNLVDTVARRR